MASPYPLIAYWGAEPAPNLDACARSLLGAVRSSPVGARVVDNSGAEIAGTPATVLRARETRPGMEIAGFALDLPAAIALFANGEGPRRREFGVSGPDRLAAFAPEEQAIVAETVKIVMRTLVEDLGAVAAWCSAFRPDHILEPWEQLDQAMAALGPGEPLPLSIIGSPAAWLMAWRADLVSDVEAVFNDGRVCFAGDARAVPF